MMSIGMEKLSVNEFRKDAFHAHDVERCNQLWPC